MTKILKFFKKTSEYLVEYDNGDQYRGEVNEDMEPHGRGVLKSKSEARSETTRGLFKNGVLHGEATISTIYNTKENKDKKPDERTGNFVNGLMQGTHVYNAFREGKYRKVIQEFENDIVIYDTNEDGTHGFELKELRHYDYLFSKNIDLNNVRHIGFDTEEVIKNIDTINKNFNKFSDLDLVFYDWSNWRNQIDRILSLFNSDNFNAKNLPDYLCICFKEIVIKKKEDIIATNEIVKNLITQVYRSFALSNLKNFEDNFEEFSIQLYDYDDGLHFSQYDFGKKNHWGYDQLENMKSLSVEEHTKLCDEGLRNDKSERNHDMNEAMLIDNEYDIWLKVKKKK